MYEQKVVKIRTTNVAMKATYGELAGPNGEVIPREIFKDPKTDSGFKKSAKGLLKVYKNEEGKIVLKDQCTPEELEEDNNMLKVVFKDGDIVRMWSLGNIRERVKNNYVYGN